MGTTDPRHFWKSAASAYTIAFEYSGRLPTGVTVSSGVASAIDLTDGSNATATVINSPTMTVDSTRLKVKVQAGTVGKSYKIISSATLSDGSLIEDSVEMHVIGL